MNILIVNDDGIKSKGLEVLANRLSLENQVFVVAPDSNRSGVSHHITMYNPTDLFEYKENWWASSGYPVDCTCIGLNSNLFDVKFDVVLSGINSGLNLGTDIIYSGTCSGARQAVLNGVPGIAVSLGTISLDKKKTLNFSPLADFVTKNLQKLIELSKINSPRKFVSINAANIDSYKGVKFSEELCIRKYNDKINVCDENLNDNKQKKSHFIMGEEQSKNNDLSDYSIVENGYICISIIDVDPICDKVTKNINFEL